MNIFLFNILVAAENPFDKLDGTDVMTRLGSEEHYFDLSEIGILLRRFIIGAGVIMFIICLVSLIFVATNEKMYEETKSRLIKIIVIVWLACSAVTIFNLIKGVTDSAMKASTSSLGERYEYVCRHAPWEEINEYREI